MVRMTDDDKFDTWLRDAANDYNRPPDSVPRDDMWQAIRASMARSGPPAAARTKPHWQRWFPLAAAAAVLVVVSYQVGKARVPVPAAAPAGGAPQLPRSDNALYTQAADEHLGQAEALLTAARSAAAPGAMDAAMQAWARDLLADTRLLIDSPAAADPARRRLLQDLELPLAQIVQLPAAGSGDDQRMVQRSLQRGELLTRIRSAAAPAVRGT